MSASRDPVAVYKEVMRELIDRRPSGTRRKLAEAFGTHPSFISQITNPSLRVPMPAQHIPALFRICHFSTEEQRRFLALYAKAHPGQPAMLAPHGAGATAAVTIQLGGVAADRRDEVASLIRDFATRVIALAQRAEPAQPIARDAKETPDEEADQRHG